jgi:threonine dehydrogenase-like Zn-dependent dehydrogenase
MQQVTVVGPNDVQLIETPEPKPGPRDVVVKVAACGICGSDLGYIAMGGMPLAGGGPLALGHEVSGIIHAVGEAVEGLEVGQRVAVNPEGAGNHIGGGGPGGGFAPYLLVRNATEDACVHPLPESLPLHQGALVEPLGVGMRAVQRAELRPADKVVVLGAGPIGLASIVCLRYLGATDIVAVDLSDMRLALAERLGARVVCNPGGSEVWEVIRDAHGRASIHGMPAVGTDVYIETTGVPDVVRDVFHNAKLGTRLVAVAVYKQEISLPFLGVMAKELTIRGSMALGREFADVIEMLASGKVDASPMITHEFAFDRFMEALETARQVDRAGKVVVTFPS